MTDVHPIGASESAGTEIVCFTVQAERLGPCVDVRHNPSYVTQLIANAADLPNPLLRRWTDRAGPLAAYALPLPRNGRTRRIV
jgi:hypothetical protein